MKYPLSNEIYNILLDQKKEHKYIIGNPATLSQLKDGVLNPTLKTLKKLFEENSLPAEIVVTVKREGKKGKTKLTL